MSVFDRMKRDFGEVFNEEKTIHRKGNKAKEVLPMQGTSSASVADMCRQKSISSDMP